MGNDENIFLRLIKQRNPPERQYAKYVNMLKMKEKKQQEFWFINREWTYLLYIIFSWKISTWCVKYWRKDQSNKLANGTKKGDELSSQQYEYEIAIPHKKNKTLLLENNIPLTCMMKGKATHPNIKSPAMMEECGNILDIEEGDKSIDRWNKDELHGNVNKNDTENNQDILEEVIY